MFHVEHKFGNMDFSIKGNYVDIFKEEIYPVEIIIKNSVVSEIVKLDYEVDFFILPGFVDSHVHIESSMLIPSEFAKIAIKHGVVGVVADPHEIANVAGTEGIEFMVNNGNSVAFNFFFGAPSCVPATEFESSGARIDSDAIDKLLKKDDIFFLSEVMNYPGVINREDEIMKKIEISHRNNKPVDGHSPGLRGADLKRYVNSGITTDHECLNLDEALEKISAGMKIQVREGSAAKSFDVFYELIDKFPHSIMLCTDDIHPDDLENGYINRLVSLGIKKGLNLFNLLRAACVNPILHYNLPLGMLRKGDNADMIVVKDLQEFSVHQTYVKGNLVYDNGEIRLKSQKQTFTSLFRDQNIFPDELVVNVDEGNIRSIKVFDKELFTSSEIVVPKVKDGKVICDIDNDLVKIVVVNRYENIKPVVGFVKGFGINRGSIAGSIAHDSHNIIGIGVDDNDIALAINAVIEMRGGLVVSSSDEMLKMPLEIGGLMTSRNGSQVAKEYSELNQLAKTLGCSLTAPFMSLSFLSLLVIPELKIGDKGLFDVNSFSFTSLFIK